MRRYNVNKRNSAQNFKRNTRHTKYANVKQGPMRGGIRM